MDIDDIDTNTVSISEGGMSQVVAMLNPDSTITAEVLEIATENGETLRITSDSDYSSVTIEIVDSND